MLNAAAKPTAVTTELGGKSALIIFEDADIQATVDWVITGFVWGSGQVGSIIIVMCCCVVVFCYS